MAPPPAPPGPPNPGVAVAVEASHPKRRGLNNGVFQCMISLFGLALGPLIATQLLQVTGWRNVFMIVGIPGLIVWQLVEGQRFFRRRVRASDD